MMYQVVHGDS